jgi:NADH:ubiquinone oxidoreductase subunit K
MEAGIFNYIPIPAILFGIGLVGVMVYERSRTSKVPESST